jgi:hypothetical protein
MQREKITFEASQPVQVKLDRSESKPIDGRNGTDYMRVCDDDARILFAPEGLELAITESGAAAGDIIQITKIPGRGKEIIWNVGIVGDQEQPAPPPRRQPAPRNTSQPQPAAQLATRERKQPAEPAAIGISSEATEMTAAYVAAIQATTAAEAYAQRLGMPAVFRISDGDTITRVALSIYIQRAKGGSK